jgi:hypothetical protein
MTIFLNIRVPDTNLVNFYEYIPEKSQCGKKEELTQRKAGEPQRNTEICFC